MKVDYSKATLEELNTIITEAATARNKLISMRRTQLLAELNELDKLSKIPSSKAIKETPSAKAIYRDKSGNSWRGKGRIPRWLKEQLAQGASLEDFKAENG
jgi:DNA-binding protein H-NS